MKQIFEILQEERDRILNLHEEATKNQYLILSEEENKIASFTTTKWNELNPSGMRNAFRQDALGKGTKFEVTSDPFKVTAKNANYYGRGNQSNADWVGPKSKRVTYFCRKGKFYIEGKTQYFYTNDDLAKSLNKNLCGKVNYKTEKAPKGTTFKQGRQRIFRRSDGQITRFTKEGTVWTWDGTKATAKDDNFNQTITFKCVGPFTVEGENSSFKSDVVLVDALKKRFCLNKSQGQDSDVNVDQDSEVNVNQENVNKNKTSQTKYKHTLKSESGDSSLTIPAKSKILPNKEKNGVTVQTENGWVWYSCKSKIFMSKGVKYKGVNDSLEKSLIKNHCEKDSINEPLNDLTGTDDGTNVQTVRNVVKPSDSALDTILTQIKSKSTPSPKPDENTGPQTWEY